MPVIDADCHVIENERTWSYMDESERKYRPLRIEAPNISRLTEQCWLIDGKIISPGAPNMTEVSQESREMGSVPARLRHMDALGVDIQVLYPSMFLRPITDRPEIELALCRSYNRWLADVWALAKDRLRWAAVLPLFSMQEALRELEWARGNGACAVFMRGFEANRHLGDSYFFPLYEAAEALDMPICAHAGNSVFAIHDFWAHAGGLSVFKFPVIDGFCSLIQSNVPTQFPELRFGFVETTAQWVPYALHFLAGRRRRGCDGVANLLKQNRMYVACQTDDDLPYVLKYAGEDNLIIGSDYGHDDAASEINALRRLRDESELSGGVVSKILDANPAALYGL